MAEVTLTKIATRRNARLYEMPIVSIPKIAKRSGPMRSTRNGVPGAPLVQMCARGVSREG